MSTGRKRPGAAKWQPQWDALLGTCSDRELAERLGVHQRTVMLHRRALGIPPCRRWGKDTPRSRQSRALRQRIKRLLRCGTRYGAKARIARLVGVSLERVRVIIDEINEEGRAQR